MEQLGFMLDRKLPWVDHTHIRRHIFSEKQARIALRTLLNEKSNN